jgi:hypothetical protein
MSILGSVEDMDSQKVGYEFGDATNPLPLQDRAVPAEVTRVEGCDCGGLEWHAEGCSIWSMPYGEARAAVDVTQARLARFTAELNARLRQALAP